MILTDEIEDYPAKTLQSQKSSESLQLNIKNMDGLIKKLKKNVMASENEYLEFINELSHNNREISLLTRKCENFENSLKESKEKEKYHTTEVKNQRQDLLLKMKEKE